MAIKLGDNVLVTAGLPIDNRYTYGTRPYSATTEAISVVTSDVRYSGLTVNVNGIEWWWKNGVGNGDLEIKTTSGGGTITGGTNGLSTSGADIILGGTLTSNVTITGGTNDFSIVGGGASNFLLGLSPNNDTIDLCSDTGANISIAYDDITIHDSGGVGLRVKTGVVQLDGQLFVTNTPTVGSTCDLILVRDVDSFGEVKTISVASIISGIGSGEQITKLICKTGHGFAVKDVIGWSGGTYNKAIADGTYDGEIIGLVTSCLNTDCFNLTQAGYVTGLTSLSQNNTYFLSDTTAGLLTTTKPTIVGHIVKSVLIANSTTSGWVLPYAGYQIAISSGDTALSIFTITGDSSTTGFTINHAKSQQFVNVQIVRNSSPYPTVYTNVERTNANCICVTFDTAPANGQQYKILIIN